MAIFMPYISYEQSTQQVEMSKLMELTQKGLKRLDAQDTSTESVSDGQSTMEDNAPSPVAYTDLPLRSLTLALRPRNLSLLDGLSVSLEAQIPIQASMERALRL